MTIPNFDVALIDADSMFYIIAATQPSPALAKEALNRYIENIIEKVEAPDVYVFIKGATNFRYAVDIEYKQNRRGAVSEELERRLALLYEYGRENFIVCEGAEADDWLGAYAIQALREEKLPVLVHIDKDINMIPGWHYNFKRDEFYFVEYAAGYSFLMEQLLQGDGTDNIKGIPKCGPVKAKKILSKVPQSEMLDVVIREYKNYFGNSWESMFVKVANCIYIRDDMSLMRPLNLQELMEAMKFNGEPEDEYIPRDTKEYDPATILYRDDIPALPTTKGDKWTTDTGLSSVTDLKEPSDSSMQSSDQPEECISEESNVSVSPPERKRGRPAKPKS